MRLETPLDLADGTRVRLRIAAILTPHEALHDATTREAPHGAIALTLVMLLLAGLAQYLFRDRLAFAWPALGCSLLAVLIASWLYRTQGLWLLRGAPPSEVRYARVGLRLTQSRVGLIGSAVLLMALVLALLASDRTGSSQVDLNWLFVPWALAIACFLVAVAQSPPVSRSKPAARTTLLILGGLGLMALVLRVWQIGSLPATLAGDEGSQGREAVAVLQGVIRNPFSTGWLGVPTMSFYFNAPTIALLGPTATALRLPWALVGTATVLVSYMLVERLHGRGLALLSAALLAAYHYHIHFSRLGSNQIADGLFAALTLLFLYRAYDRRSQFDWAVAGIVIAVAQYFYAGARFTVVLAFSVVLFFVLRDGRRFWREHGWGVAVLAVAALLAAAPMIQYALRFPDDYNARINQVGIFQSGWLEREQQVRDQGPLPILLDQFQRAALAYNAYPDRTVWYGSRWPLFDLAHGTLFLLGLGFALLRPLDRRLFPLLAWWGGAVIMGGALTESPPSSQRLVTTAIPAVVFVAIGLAMVTQGLGRALVTTRPQVVAAILAAVTLALMGSSVSYYFLEYTPLRIYGGSNALLATSLAAYVNQHLAADTQLVFFGWPRMSVNFGTIPYLAPHVERTDVMEPLARPPPPDLAAPDRPLVFVFVPERVSELAYVRTTFPAGIEETVPAPLDGSILFTLYRVEPVREGR